MEREVVGWMLANSCAPLPEVLSIEATENYVEGTVLAMLSIRIGVPSTALL